jgi:hypothetical protein
MAVEAEFESVTRLNGDPATRCLRRACSSANRGAGEAETFVDGATNREIWHRYVKFE